MWCAYYDILFYSYAAVQVGMVVKQGHTFYTALSRRNLTMKIFVATVTQKRIACVDLYYSWLAIIPNNMYLLPHVA